MIRTIVRKSERKGGRLSFKRYKDDTAKARGVSLTPGLLKKRYYINLNKKRGNAKSLQTKQEQRQVSTVVEQKRNTSIWAKVKNFFKGR